MITAEGRVRGGRKIRRKESEEKKAERKLEKRE